MAYPVTVDALHTVFSPYGFVMKITLFDKGGVPQVPPSCQLWHCAQAALAWSGQCHVHKSARRLPGLVLHCHVSFRPLRRLHAELLKPA